MRLSCAMGTIRPDHSKPALVPPYVRRPKTLEAALPWLCLKGVSRGEMAPALKALLGPDAAGLSANTISRLKRDWVKQYGSWRDAALDDEPSSTPGLMASTVAYAAKTTNSASL